jgi:hydrogenase expression/formation protein HypE
MANEPDFENWSCPIPLRDYPTIVLGHGGGGKLSSELIDHLFVPAFRNETLASMGDAAVLKAPEGRLAFTTDSFVVSPLFFPGGSIGELAVHGTVNDLAMVGATPLFLSAGFILEEGFPMAQLAAVVDRMSRAAEAAGIRVVTGDTKVVERGRGHGCYINTAGVGAVPDGVSIGPDRARAGDVVLLSGSIGDHGMAVMSVREGLEFETVIESDSTSLHGLVEAMLEESSAVRVLRDPTRGGLAASLNEIARSSKAGIVIEESKVLVRPEVHSACELLGLDPLHVANEGKLVAIVDPHRAEAVLDRMLAHPLGRDAARIGVVTEENPGLLAATTPIGGTRIIPTQIGEQLPRIC